MGYVAESQVLTIEFVGGETFTYIGVTKAVYNALQAAESKGRFYMESIRGKYATETAEVENMAVETAVAQQVDG